MNYTINTVPGCYDNCLINLILATLNKERRKFMCLGLINIGALCGLRMDEFQLGVVELG